MGCSNYHLIRLLFHSMQILLLNQDQNIGDVIAMFTYHAAHVVRLQMKMHHGEHLSPQITFRYLQPLKASYGLRLYLVSEELILGIGLNTLP